MIHVPPVGFPRSDSVCEPIISIPGCERDQGFGLSRNGGRKPYRDTLLAVNKFRHCTMPAAVAQELEVW